MLMLNKTYNVYYVLTNVLNVPKKLTVVSLVLLTESMPQNVPVQLVNMMMVLMLNVSHVLINVLIVLLLIPVLNVVVTDISMVLNVLV